MMRRFGRSQLAEGRLELCPPRSGELGAELDDLASEREIVERVVAFPDARGRHATDEVEPRPLFPTHLGEIVLEIREPDHRVVVPGFVVPALRRPELGRERTAAETGRSDEAREHEAP